MILNKNLPPFHQTALVTGGSKRIGAAIVEKLVMEKFAVAIHYHQSQIEAINLRNKIMENGGKAEIFAADLRNREAIIQLIPKIYAIMPPITLLINNASIFQRDEWDNVDFTSWDQHIMTNLEAPFWLSQAMAKQLPENYRGAIINMIDQRVLKLTPHFMSYTIAKSGLWSLTRSLALALAPQIRVNAIGPGPTLPSTMQDDLSFKKQYQKTPLKQATPVTEICEAIIFILKQTSMMGQMIALDGGEHLGWRQEINNDD